MLSPCVRTASCLVLDLPGSNWQGRIRPKVIYLLFLTYLSRRFYSFKEGSSNNDPGQEEAESQVPHDPAGVFQPTRALQSHFAESTRWSHEEGVAAAHTHTLPLQINSGKLSCSMQLWQDSAASSKSEQLELRDWHWETAYLTAFLPSFEAYLLSSLHTSLIRPS